MTVNDALHELSRQIREVSDIYADRFDINRDDIWYLGKISEELGELHAAYFKLSGRGRKKDKADPELRADLEDELADLFAHVLLFAQHHDISIADALARKWLVHRSG